MKIEGKVILITGGASGIGKTTAEYLSSKGSIVYTCDIQDEKNINFVQYKNNSTTLTNPIKYLKCDVSNESEVQKMIDTIFNLHGRIDVVINNAGIPGMPENTKEEVSKIVKNFINVYKVNLLGTFLVSKYAAKKMIETYSKDNNFNGVIIHISSIMGLQGIPFVGSYSASKGAVIGMTLPMARDLGKYKIRVNSICPGLIETPLGDNLSALKKSIIRSTPIGRVGNSMDIAHTCGYIIENDFINGSLVKVDGGIIGASF